MASFFRKLGSRIESQIERTIYVPWIMVGGCCEIEVKNAATATYDWKRLGVGKIVDHPSKADVMIVGGWINLDRAEEIKIAYSHLVGAKSVIAIGSCVLSGSPYLKDQAILASQILPVDVYVPGCPPRPEAILEAFHLLKQKRKPEKNQDKVIYEALRGPERT